MVKFHAGKGFILQIIFKNSCTWIRKYSSYTYLSLNMYKSLFDIFVFNKTSLLRKKSILFLKIWGKNTFFVFLDFSYLKKIFWDHANKKNSFQHKNVIYLLIEVEVMDSYNKYKSIQEKSSTYCCQENLLDFTFLIQFFQIYLGCPEKIT